MRTLTDDKLLSEQRINMEAELIKMKEIIKNMFCKIEQIRLEAFESHPLPITLPLARVTSKHIKRWTQWRATQVSGSSIRRELTLLSSVFAAAQKDWDWIQTNPTREVRRPPENPSRKTVLTKPQIKAMLRALGYRRARPQTVKQVVAHMMLLSLRTGMRSGEMVGLTWSQVKPTFVQLAETKNGDARNVPLSRKARPIIERMRGCHSERVFPVKSWSRDAIWRKARNDAGVSGIVFHDCRRTAATWIARDVGKPGKPSFTDFVTMFGWRDPKYAMIYVRPSAAEIAELL